ncbi:hypothetical protein [Cardinium endosymbiont of Sogatella furcifera]|uniref:hypothetical protein n=1 Tax=Cardinium endosymbiont of Sogatella furcifera TaxID=650378 RepID=UPI000E0D42D6|nr:hypothetical protein [Cardinium endosymbiont of Sogatella furcifera]
MQIVPIKQTHLPYSFYLVILLSLATACKKKTKPYNLSLSKQGQDPPNVTPPTSPSPEVAQNKRSNTTPPVSLKQGQNKRSNTAPPASSAQWPMHNASSKKTDQASITHHLDKMIQHEKSCRKTFSQALNPVQDLNERDKMIAEFVKARNQRIDIFNQTLKKVADSHEKQRLISEFEGVKEMCQEANALNSRYVNLSDPIEQKKKNRERGDIVESYNGYSIESKRQQIRRRVEALMQFARENRDKLPNMQNKQEEGASCAICHSAGSVGLLPCGDCVHTDCLAEKMIATWRKGIEYISTCPGSCDRYIHFHYFLSDDTYAFNQLTLTQWEEIFFKPKQT